jgi:carboxyl-terminal processing protease
LAAKESDPVPQRNITWLLAAAVISLICYGEAHRNRYAGILSESMARIAASYVEPVDRRALFEGGMEGMLRTLDDYSGYIRPEDYQQFRSEIAQHFGGIGIEVGMEDGRIIVLSPVPGSPAHQAGLMAGDVIVTIDRQNVESATLMDAVKLMRGEVGTPVRVEVRRTGEEELRQYTIVRADIRIDSVRGDLRDAKGHWQFTLEDHPRIGYIRLTSFGDESAAELQTALETMLQSGAQGLILDLRGNAGGLLTSAVTICDMFIPPDLVIVSTRGRDGQVFEEFRSEVPPIVSPDLPVVILVDRFSASASEIVAACLQDHQRAVIVGERTWGKGTVQNVFPIEGGRSAIRLTTQTYWRPSGQNIHQGPSQTYADQWGVTPAKENLVPFSRDEYMAVDEARRERDRFGKQQPANTDQPPSDQPPIVDSQLKRAIDVMNKLLL